MWRRIRHLFFHEWGEIQSWRSPLWGPKPPSVLYRRCKMCNAEKIRRVSDTGFWWQTVKVKGGEDETNK